MHILLTRPLEDCSEMILKFKSLGNQVSHLPLIRIEPVSYSEINFLEYKSIIFTSSNNDFFRFKKYFPNNLLKSYITPQSSAWQKKKRNFC